MGRVGYGPAVRHAALLRPAPRAPSGAERGGDQGDRRRPAGRRVVPLWRRPRPRGNDRDARARPRGSRARGDRSGLRAEPSRRRDRSLPRRAGHERGEELILDTLASIDARGGPEARRRWRRGALPACERGCAARPRASPALPSPPAAPSARRRPCSRPRSWTSRCRPSGSGRPACAARARSRAARPAACSPL